MKKVSVIIPCHNATKWLPQCFLSLVKQTIGIAAIELIFVDDASNDDGQTWMLLEQFERAYPESIIAIRLERNMRQGGARNIGISYATGEYLAFVDADDFVAENYLEEVYNRAIADKADIVQFESFFYTERLGEVPTGRTVMEEVIRIESAEQRKEFLLSEKITYGCWNKLYRRSMVLEAGVQYAEHVIYEEPLFVYPLLYYGKTFVILDKAYYFYRQNEAGTMRSDMKQLETLKMHAEVQYQVWKFMKQTPFFETFYEEIKLYFLHTFYYETLLFGEQRGFAVPEELVSELKEIIKSEISDFMYSKYENIIPKQMELYRRIK